MLFIRANAEPASEGIEGEDRCIKSNNSKFHVELSGLQMHDIPSGGLIFSFTFAAILARGASPPKEKKSKVVSWKSTAPPNLDPTQFKPSSGPAAFLCRTAEDWNAMKSYGAAYEKKLVRLSFSLSPAPFALTFSLLGHGRCRFP